MPGRGVLFALTIRQEKRVLAEAQQGNEALSEVVEEIEEAWDQDHLEETDKAWDAIHRCLSDGTLEFEGGTEPHHPWRATII